MLERFYPDEYRDSAYELDYERLYAAGFRGIIFDIDNTLVPHGAPADERSVALFRRLHGIGYSCVLLSNNKEPRVKPFAGPWNGWEHRRRPPFLWGISFLRMCGGRKTPGSAASW